MMITAAPAKLAFMTMTDILALASVDAEAENDYRMERGEEPMGTLVSDIIPGKQADIQALPGRYDALRESMIANGQTAPLAVNAGYLLNGGHRVAMAMELNWPGMWTTDDHEASEDRTWNAQHPRSTFA